MCAWKPLGIRWTVHAQERAEQRFGGMESVPETLITKVCRMDVVGRKRMLRVGGVVYVLVRKKDTVDILTVYHDMSEKEKERRTKYKWKPTHYEMPSSKRVKPGASVEEWGEYSN